MEYCLKLCILLLSVGLFISVSDGVCPTGWIYYNKSCYLFSDGQWRFNDAKRICATRQGWLTKVMDINEQNFLSNEAKKRKGKNYWIGLTDIKKEKSFVWIKDNKPLTAAVSRWANKQPDNHRNNEDCVQYASWAPGQWNDATCTSTCGYICERLDGTLDKCDRENGWHELKSKCYKFYETPQNWQDSRDQCVRDNGDLLVVNDNDELRFIKDTVSCSNAITTVWLGISDGTQKGVFKWLDNTPAKGKYPSNWDTSEPNSANPGNDCGEVVGLNDYKWETDKCSALKKFICERTQGRCPRGWRTWKDKCYQIRSAPTLKTTWPEAKQFCETQGAGLVIANDATEQRYIASLSYNILRRGRVADFWIGISDLSKDGSTLNDNVFTLTDGATPTYTQWATRQPTKRIKGLDCGLVQTGNRQAKWLTSYCFSKKAYICEMKISVRLKVIAPTAATFRCPTGWLRYTDSCYKFSTQETTWADARTQCQQFSADLASVTSPLEQAYLARNIRAITWIGLNDVAKEGTFVWSDAKPVTFTNWNPTEPNQSGNEDCAEMAYPGASTGGWNDKVCTTKRDFVCKAHGRKIVNPTLPPVVTRPWNPLCGSGWYWSTVTNYCYQVNMDLKTWDQARAQCITNSGTLLSIGGPDEQSYITGILSTMSGNGYWIGATDRTVEGGWEWADGKPFVYINWRKGEPNAWKGGEDCVELSVSSGGKWNDAKCPTKLNYMCKKLTTAVTTVAPNVTPSPYSCIGEMMISGTHWLSNQAISASSSLDYNHLPMNSRLNWGAAGAVIKINTNKQYNYKYQSSLDLRGVTAITFRVKANNDAHISLSPTGDSKDKKIYEIVLGGWGGKKSVIRENQQSSQRVAANTPSILNANSLTPFWISWLGGFIKIGRGNVVGARVFLQWADPTPYRVYRIGVSTGWGSNGVWEIDNPYSSVKVKVTKGAWVPKTNNNQWIMADFGVPITVKAIVTQGRADADNWVTTYKVAFKYDPDDLWHVYEDPVGTQKIFTGNVDRNTQVSNSLASPFQARYVQVKPVKYNARVSMRWDVVGCLAAAECTAERLVSGAYNIPDSALKSSSDWDSKHSAKNVRLHTVRSGGNTGAWSAKKNDVNQYLQVDLGMKFRIRGIILQGRQDYNQWVTNFKVSFSFDNKVFQFYSEPYGQVKTFRGNSDRNTLVTNMFRSPFEARYVRVNPTTWNGHVSMRMDVLGCLLGCQPVALINGPHPVSNRQLRSSSNWDSNHGYTRSRLNTIRQGALRGAWSSKYNRRGQWLQVDFGVAMRIRGIATQGRQDINQWVISYIVRYTTDAKIPWKYYKVNNKNVVFNANWDQNTVDKNFFPYPITARFLRLYPQTWTRHMSLRWEVYGCPGPAATTLIGCFQDSRRDRDLPYYPLNQLGMGPRTCTNHCFQKGYTYAGIQGGRYCYCSSSYGKHGPTTGCTYKCRSNPKQLCGGSYKNSVYSTGIAPYAKRCPDGWVAFSGSCYKAMTTVKRTWQDAQTDCRSQGGDLATINSKAEQNFLVTFKKTMWIGLNDLRHQMYFEWSNDEPAKFTIWTKNEPNNWQGKSEDCVVSWFPSWDTSIKGTWNDALCSDKNFYFCESDPQVSTLPVPTNPPRGCDVGWIAYGTSCYLLRAFNSNWANADKFCKNIASGATLLRINDAIENAYIASNLGDQKGEFWTDLSDAKTKGTYIWSNGWSVIPYINWGKGQPDDRNGSCVSMGTGLAAGLMFDRKCTWARRVICERTRTGFRPPPLPTLSISNAPCSPGWVGQGSDCFQINDRNRTDQLLWIDARIDCQNKGGDLASFHNDTQFDYIWRQFLVGKQQNYWIGLNNRDTSRGHTWSDGSAVQYTNWNKNEPNNWGGRERCVEVLIANGKWNDAYGGVPRNWICKLPKGKTPQTVTTTLAPTAGPPGSCGAGYDDWKSYNGSCYYFSSGVGAMALTWRQARRWCAAKKSHLASIGGQTEQSFLQGQTKALGSNWMWIGLNELYVTSGYRWSDRSPASYFNWRTLEPNDHNGEEKCVAMVGTNGKWLDNLCSATLGFICEKGPTYVQPTWVPKKGNCPAGWNHFELGRRCFKFFGDIAADRKNWTAARAHCKTFGGLAELASVNWRTQQAYITSLLKDKQGYSLWIGLFRTYRQIMGAAFHWTDNEDVTFTNWKSSEPNGKDKEPCVEMYTGKNFAGKWNDVSCSANRGYICEMPRDPAIPDPAPVPNNCPASFVPWYSGCYSYQPNARSWTSADAYCKSKNSNLVSITSPYEQAFIFRYVRQENGFNPVWTGLTDSFVHGQYGWTDNWPVLYTNWGLNEPTFQVGEGCVTFNASNGRWADISCNGHYGFICKTTTETPPHTVAPATGSCPDDDKIWFPYNGYCYLFEASAKFSFAEADALCMQRGALVVSIHDSKENNFTYNHFKGYNVWTSLIRDQAGGWGWKDGSPVQYTNWHVNEPNNFGKNDENCVELWGDGTWNDENCYAKRGYVCKRLQGVASQTLPTLAPKSTLSTLPPGPTPSPPTQGSTTPGTTMPPWVGPKSLLGNEKNADAGVSFTDDSLRTGMVVGMAVGVVGLIVIIALVVIICRHKSSSGGVGGFDNALYQKGDEVVNVSVPNMDHYTEGNGFANPLHTDT